MKKGITRAGVRALAGACLFFGPAGAAMGQSWTGLAGTGLFSTPNNWSGVAVPTSAATTTLAFPGSPGYTVTLDAGVASPFALNSATFSGTGSDVLLKSGTFSFSGVGPAIVQSGSAGASFASTVAIAAGTSLTVGGTGAGTVSLTGTLTGSSGTLAMAGTSLLRLAGGTVGELVVTSGNARLVGGTLSAGAGLNTTSVWVGSLSTAQAQMSLTTGGTFSTTGVILIGPTNGASGLLSVGAGAEVVVTGTSTNALTAAGGALSSGDVSVSGTGALISVPTTFFAGSGSASHAGVSVTTGGKLAGSNSYLGLGAGSTANVNVNAGTLAMTGMLASYLGSGAGSATALTVSSGGTTSFAGPLVASPGSNAQTSITVSGTGSKISTGGISLAVNAGALANLSASGGAAVTANSTMFMSAAQGAVSSATFSGSGTTLSLTSPSLSTLYMSGGNGTGAPSGSSYLGVRSGAAATIAGELSMASSVGGVAIASVAGTGSTLSAARFTVGGGSNSQAGLYVGSGASVTQTGVTNSAIGAAAGAVGRVTVDAASMSIGTAPTLTIGSGTSATGTLEVRNFGVASLSTAAAQLLVGSGASASGTLQVSAGGTFAMTSSTSQLTLAAGTNAAASVLVDGGLLTGASTKEVDVTGTFASTGSTATIAVRNGGRFQWAGGTARWQVGNASGTTSTINIDNGTFTNSTTGETYLGMVSGATVNVNVSNQGSLKFGTGSLWVGYQFQSVANVNVTGGGTLYAPAGAAFGVYGHADVTVSSGGSIIAGVIQLAYASAAGATMTVNDGTVVSQGGMYVGTGGSFPEYYATLNLNSGTVALSGQLQVGAPGTVNLNGGTLTATNLDVGSSPPPVAGGHLNFGGGTLLLAGSSSSTGFGVFSATALAGTQGSMVVTNANLAQTLTNAGNTFTVPIEVRQGTLGFYRAGAAGPSGTLALGAAGYTSAAHAVLYDGATLPRDVTVAGPAATVAQLDFSGTGAATGSGSWLLNKGLTIAAGTGSVTLSGAISGVGGLTVSSGLVTLTGSLGYSGATWVKAGQLALVAPLVAPGSSVTASATGQVNFLAPASAGAHVRFGEVGTVVSSSYIGLDGTPDGLESRVLVAGRLVLTTIQNLDLTNNDMVVRQMTEQDVATLFRNRQLFASAAGSITTLGITANVDGRGGALFDAFDDVGVGTTDVLVRFTYAGDTDLSGAVDGADLANLLAGMSGHLSGWANGDVNYSGTVEGADLTLLLGALAGQGAPLGGPGGLGGGHGGAVPEPSMAGGWVAGAVALGLRRRRTAKVAQMRS